MRLFFGRAHSTYRLIDDEFYSCMILNNYNVEKSLIALKSILLTKYRDLDVHTINPLLLKFGVLDEYIHYIDGSGDEIRVMDAPYYESLKKIHYNMEFFIMENADVWPKGALRPSSSS